MIKGQGNQSSQRHEYVPSRAVTITSPAASESNLSAARQEEQSESRPGVLERIKETPVYDRLTQEAAVVGNRFVDEISKKAQEVILPAAVGWVGSWLERLLPTHQTQRSNATKSN
jgi:hypothetical protein